MMGLTLGVKVTEVVFLFFVFNFEGGCGWLWFLTPGSQPPIKKNGGNSFLDDAVFNPLKKHPYKEW